MHDDPLSRPTRLHLVQPNERLAERAWRLHTFGLPRAPGEWLDLVEAFVADARPSKPERTAAVLLLALDNCHGWDAFVEGRWIYLIPPHVYVHFEGSGIGALRAYALTDRLLRWMDKQGCLHPWDAACLRHLVDRQRASVGGEPRGVAPAWDALSSFHPLEKLTADFIEGGNPEAPPHLVEATVRLLAAATRLRGTDVVRFGALDPVELWQADVPEDPAFLRDVARLGARFYRWLGEEGHLEPGRARQIEHQLVRLVTVTRGEG